MSSDVLHVMFNGHSKPLKSIIDDIRPDLYTMKECLKMIENTREAKPKAHDEIDSEGPISACDSEPMTLPDGKINNVVIGDRVSGRGMNEEINRLATFRGWPENNPMSFQHLARAGFYYTGVRDAVRCFSCGGQVEGWEYGDTAMGEHKKLFPKCDFANERTTNNVSLFELHERPEFERKLSSRIEQSQREIERRAKEKEAMLERVDPSETKRNFVTYSGTSNFAVADENMEEEEEQEAPSMLFGKFNQEHARLQSFKNWPRTSPIEPRDLAKAGFYYLGKDDSVQCFACFGQISRWKPCDVPGVEHKTHFPNCPFVKGLDVGNLPISTPPVMHGGMPPPIRSYSTPGPSPDQLRAGEFLQQQRNLRASMGPLNNCKHPNYVQENARLITFRNWPGNPGLHVTPRILAKAGFYYTGLVDECKCFYCDGGLKNWEPTDEPWTEHAKWFPRCEWLIQQRGQAFISHVQQVNPPPITSPPLRFANPPIGREEPYSQVQPPHSFQASYQERQPQTFSKSSPPLSRSKKEMTIEEEKEAALREYESRHREPEAAAEIRQKVKNIEAAEPFDLKSKLRDEAVNATRSIDDFMQSPTAQMAVEMGYHTDLIRYVVTKHFKTTGQEFSSADDLLESIWEAQGLGVDPTPSVGKATGGHDVDYLKKPPKEMEYARSSAMPSSSVDIQAMKLAGLSIHDDDDEPPRRRNQSPKTVPPATPIGSLKPQTSVSSAISESSILDKQLCKICLDNELSTVFLPCKHLATCSDCAARVSECPMCRQPIIDSLTVFMP